MVPTYPMYEQFRKEALALRIPQFFIKMPPNLLSFVNPDKKILLDKELLGDGFRLKDKDTDIDFGDAGEPVVSIDVERNERPKYRQLPGEESERFKDMMQSLPPEGRVRNCKIKLKQNLEHLDGVSGKDLAEYIDRIVENMGGDEIVGMQKNIYGYTEKIRKKIVELLTKYRKQQFYHMLETGKIECLPSFTVQSEIIPGSKFDLLSKSLYTSEQSINGFELKVIEKVAALPNVKWWHRNIDRVEFSINGFINPYPDFIVMTHSGKVVMLETKGGHLATNDDSRDKAELGKVWQAQAGGNYRYYMVGEAEYANNPDVISLDTFMKIMKEL